MKKQFRGIIGLVIALMVFIPLLRVNATTHTVTFDSKGGSAVTSQTVEDGGYAVKPDNPTYGTLEFFEWRYNDASFSFNTPITDDITLDAIWKFEISAYAYPAENGLVTTGNNPSFAGTEKTDWWYYNPDNLAGFQAIPNVGYILKEWRVGSPTGEVLINDYSQWASASSVNGMVVHQAANLTAEQKKFYAIFEPKSWTVSFDMGGHGQQIEATTIGNGGLLTPPEQPSEYGYRLEAWYKEPSFENVFEFEEDTITGDITLYAKWVDADKINHIDITNVPTPYIGDAPSVEGITISTHGVHVKDATWCEEGKTCFEHTVSKFEKGKRYILVVVFELENGYILADDFGDDSVTVDAEHLMQEFVEDGPDVRIYFDTVEKPEAPISPSTPKITTAPKVTVKNANDNTLLVSWVAVENATKYEVYRGENSKKFKKIKTVETTSFTDTKLTYGKKYYYKVKAINDISSKTSSVVKGATKPNKVENLTAKAGTNNVKLSWDKVNVTGYEVYNGSKKIATITKNKTVTYNQKKLKANKKYTYKVRAYKKVGSKKVYGPWSDSVTIYTAPDKPKVSLVVKDFDTITIKRSVKKGTTYLLESYKVDNEDYYGPYDSTNFENSDQSGLEPGRTYYYKVKACNADDSCSGWVEVKVKLTPLAPKVSLSTESKKVSVTLTGVNGAVGYEVYRSTSKKGKYKSVGEITDLENLVLVDSTKKGTTYYYKVRSYMMVNGKKLYSPYSSIKKIKSK